MKIITYSDLHLEFGHGFKPDFGAVADLMILAGDIITFKDYKPLQDFLEGWNKPVLFVAGNHEYYTRIAMAEEDRKFRTWLSQNLPNVHFLTDEAITIEGVNFFGGTMWTDFAGGSTQAMNKAKYGMNDYRYIALEDGKLLSPEHTVQLHQQFKENLLKWFEEDFAGTRVVISHHAPVINPKTKYGESELMPAFNSLDMIDIIERYQPALWVYGHTHECDNHKIGKTQIISNQLGYPKTAGNYECEGFDEKGVEFETK